MDELLKRTRKKKYRVCDRQNRLSICKRSSYQPETPTTETNAKINEDKKPSTIKKRYQNIKTTSTARSMMQVLLLTARTYAYTEKGTKLVTVRVLLDSGSQRTYTSNDLKRKCV